jgi:2-isopropylmalate synthase
MPSISSTATAPIPAYALSCLRAAHDAGARWIVLCDTNGGTLPAEVGRIVAEVIAAGIPGDRLGIHATTTPAMRWPTAGRGRGRLPPGAGHAERLGRTLRQCQPDDADPDLALKEPYPAVSKPGFPRRP